MKTLSTFLFFACLVFMCADCFGQKEPRIIRSLEGTHRDHTLRLKVKWINKQGWVEPKKSLFSIVHYKGKAGRLSAMLSKPPRNKNPKIVSKHPAIIWVTGGFPQGGMDSSAWMKPDPNNEQSAQAYRKAKIITMYPSFRGDRGNDGFMESFFGEVHDVIAAAEYLKTLPHIDPKRIYLGGHSTGGTLALLAAELSDTFRAVFSFGPASDPAVYGTKHLNYDTENDDSRFVRAPLNYLHCIRTPTFVIEAEDGRIESLHELKAANKNPLAQFLAIQLGDHFDILHGINQLLAKKIVKLVDDKPFKVTQKELQAAYFSAFTASRKQWDEQQLEELRRSKEDLKKPRLVAHFFSSDVQEKIRAAADYIESKKGLGKGTVRKIKPEGNPPYYTLTVTKKLSLKSVRAINAMSKKMCKVRHDFGIHYNGWDLDD